MALWQTAPLPAGFTCVWRHELATHADLARLRARVRTEVTGSPVVVHPERELWSERLVLIIDELASNALRHGGGRVLASVGETPEAFLVDVSDQAPAVPPTPAVDRDPSEGGLGLYLIAELATEHGWYVRDGAKHVWALLPRT